MTSANLCKPIHDIIHYATTICSFESGNCGKEGKTQKFEYLENEKRTFFIVFEGLSFGEKIKLWLKTVDTSFMYVTHVILSGFYAADSTHQYLVFSNP